MSSFYKVILVCSLFLFSFFIPIFSSPQYESNDSSEIVKISVLSAYDNYTPISISGNSDFSTKAFNFGWLGNGSQNNPYIITQINITQYDTATNLLQVDNTDAYFIINASLFVGGADAIHLTNVANGRIIYNTIYHTISSGIYLSNCENCTIENNTITDNANRGVLIDFSENCTVEENTIEDCTGDGLKLRDSSEDYILHNRISNNRGSGIVLGMSVNCSLIGNIINSNWKRGISVESSTPVQLINNTIYENSEEGASLSGLDPPIIVSGNTFYHNGFFGLLLMTNMSQINKNNFIDNNQAFEYMIQVDDHSSTNNYSGNYWNEWVYPDSDNDNVVDIPYKSNESPLVIDQSPMVFAFPNYALHILTRPIPILPNESSSYGFATGITDVIWGPSSDTFGHDVHYSLEYSPNDTTLWNSLVSNLTDTSYQWNTTDQIQNKTYSLRIIAECESDSIDSIFHNNITILQHTLSEPTLLYPNGGELIGGHVEITWKKAIDSWGLSVYYSVYYSSDAGISWNVIDSQTIEQRTGWGLDNIPDGSYLIKVKAISDDGLENEDITDSEFTILRILEYSNGIVGITLVSVIIIALVVIFRRRKSFST